MFVSARDSIFGCRNDTENEIEQEVVNITPSPIHLDSDGDDIYN